MQQFDCGCQECQMCAPHRLNPDGSKTAPVSKAEIAERLRELADEMDEIAVLMDYYGGFAEWAKNRRYVRDAAGLARLWSYEIEDMTNG